MNIIDIIRKVEIALASGELELKLPRLGELRVIFSDLNILLKKKYGVVYSKLGELYNSSKINGNEILERVMTDTKAILNYMREDVPIFCQRKINEFSESVQPTLTSIVAFVEISLKELQKMRQEVEDFCEEKRVMFYKTCAEARQMTFNHTRMLLERSKHILDDLRKQFEHFNVETKANIEKLFNSTIQMKDDLKQALSEHREELDDNIIAYYKSIDINKFMNKYIDVEDLKNKTIELKEDVMNLSLIHDLVELGESCYAEGQRLADLVKETSQFAMYVIMRIVKYSDIWEIVEELTNPFHWIPPSNSMYFLVYNLNLLYVYFAHFKFNRSLCDQKTRIANDV